MSPTRKTRRPAPRAGRTSRTKRGRALANGSRSNRAWYAATALIVIAGVALIVLFRPSTGASGGIKVGQHWHAALGVYICDDWDGGAAWPTAQEMSGLHSHRDGLIHIEPVSSHDAGENANLGRFLRDNGYGLSASSIKFATADVKNGDTCGNSPGKLHWLVNGKERTGDPAKYLMRDQDWIVIAFLPDNKKITSLGKPPSYPNLAKQ